MYLFYSKVLKKKSLNDKTISVFKENPNKYLEYKIVFLVLLSLNNFDFESVGKYFE